MMWSRRLAVVFLILTVLWSCVIWSFSLDSAEKSTIESDRVSNLLSEIVEKVVGEKIELTQHAVRKTAHFTEFAILGALLYMTLSLWKVKNVGKSYLIGAIASAVIALTDECIQLFSPGRSAQLSDVMLDITGATVAFSVCLVLALVIKRICKGKCS